MDHYYYITVMSNHWLVLDHLSHSPMNKCVSSWWYTNHKISLFTTFVIYIVLWIHVGRAVCLCVERWSWILYIHLENLHESFIKPMIINRPCCLCIIVKLGSKSSYSCATCLLDSALAFNSYKWIGWCHTCTLVQFHLVPGVEKRKGE